MSDSTSATGQPNDSSDNDTVNTTIEQALTWLRTRDAHEPTMNVLIVLAAQVLLQLETPILGILSNFTPATDKLPAISSRIFRTEAALLEVVTFDGHCSFEYTPLSSNGERTSEPLFMSCKLDSNGELSAPAFRLDSIVHRIRNR